MINRVLCLLESSIKDQSGVVAIKRFSRDRSWQTEIQFEFFDKLYKEDIIFGRYPKDENGRLALINWVSKELETPEIQEMPEYQKLKAKWQELIPFCEKFQSSAGLQFVKE